MLWWVDRICLISAFPFLHAWCFWVYSTETPGSLFYIL